MKIKRKITLIFILTILILTNIASAITIYSNINSNKVEIGDDLEFTIKFDEKIQTADFSVYYDNQKITYIGANTGDLKTNYLKENNELICCYYDLNKIGTDEITLKFKATSKTNKTNINVKNITIHINSEEKQIDNIISENIKIENKKSNQENNFINNSTNNNENNSINNVINDENQNIEISQKDNNSNIDNTISVKPLPNTGLKFDFRIIIIIIIMFIFLIIVIKNEELTKKSKIILTITIILISTMIFLSKYVFAENEDKIFINKKDKTILVVLSTSNKERTMTTQEFKNKTKAVSMNKENISGAIATFKNNEKYTVKIYKDENNDGYVNSTDIYELLYKEDFGNNTTNTESLKNIDVESISELSNFIIKKEELKNYNITPNGYEEFTEKSISTPNTTPLQPAQDRYTEIKNIEELKQINSKVGDKYKTLGYYTENDGGAGRYDIIEKSDSIKVDNGLYIELNNGLIAKLAIINKTVNVKQFGAKGDSINDDTKNLRTAFNSGIANVELPKGEYKITDKISLDTESTNIIGNNSIIFTNNDYKPEKYSEFLIIMHSDNCNISNLSIEARETENIENLYKAQVYVGATNINITKCTFKIPETTSNKHSYSNIDLYTGWHNVLIEDCDLYLANDAKEGGCIWIRDLFNRGASNVTFTNNRCYKKCHDEILAIFMGSIENVNILNNTFTMPKSTDPSTMCFTIGSNSSKKAENIRFEGNTIDTKATMSLLNSRNATNLSIKNNKIKFERDTELTNTFLMYFPKDNAENNSKNVTIENNEIEINNNTQKAFNNLIATNAENISLSKNTIIVNSAVLEAFTGKFSSISNNNITFNKSLNILVNKPKEFTENNIIFNNGFGTIAQYHGGDLDYNSNIKNNVFTNNFDEIGTNGKSILLMFNGGTLNNHIVTFEGNIINSNKANYRRNLIYLLNLADTTPQTIKFINNKFNGYKQGWKDKNQEIHQIIINNT